MKWIINNVNDICECSNCGFGYFNHAYFFKSGMCVATNGQTTYFDYCPTCGEPREGVELRVTDSVEDDFDCPTCEYYNIEEEICGAFECNGIDCPELPCEKKFRSIE